MPTLLRRHPLDPVSETAEHINEAPFTLLTSTHTVQGVDEMLYRRSPVFHPQPAQILLIRWSEYKATQGVVYSAEPLL